MRSLLIPTVRLTILVTLGTTALAHSGIPIEGPIEGPNECTSALDPKDGPDVDLRWVIESGEVRLRIITNLAFIDETTDSVREQAATLDPVEAEDAMQGLLELFEGRNRLVIDGIEATPIDPTVKDSFEYDPGDESLYPHFKRFGARAVAKTRLTLRYPCKTPPTSVSLTWGVYPINMSLPPDPDGTRHPIEPIARLVADGREQIVRFKVDDATFTWVRAPDGEESFLEVVPAVTEDSGARFPWPAAGLFGLAVLGAAFGPRGLRMRLFGPLAVVAVALGYASLSAKRIDRPEGTEARAVFEPLLTNIYRAFDYTEESRVYDVLEQSASGPVLRDLYDDIYSSLVMQEEDGGLCRAERVTFLEVTDDTPPTNDARFAVEALWQVDGVVYHSDHGHTQKNEHRARFEVEATVGGWRIASYSVLEQRRVDAAPLKNLESKTGSEWRQLTNDDLPEEF